MSYDENGDSGTLGGDHVFRSPPTIKSKSLFTRLSPSRLQLPEIEIASLFVDDDQTSIRECMLTTIDNPFNPFVDYANWEQFDLSHGYYSASYLARIAVTSNDLSDADEALAIERAIDEIVAINSLGVYRKVVKDVATPLS